VTAKGQPLLQAFSIDKDTRVIAIVGGGGKTSLMFSLAAEMTEAGKRVVTTTTTKIFPPKSSQSPCLILLDDDPQLAGLGVCLERFGHATVGRCLLAEGKVEGVPEAVLRKLLQRAQWVVVEADGAAGRPVKAPESWEPVIPSFADLVIHMVGLDCIGRPATADWVFRLEKFLSVSGLAEADRITPQSIGRLLGRTDGALQGVPDRARVIPLLNKVDLLENWQQIEELAEATFSVARSRISRIVAAKLKGGTEVKVLEPRGGVASTEKRCETTFGPDDQQETQ
jgi:probable selenium-dependent hydroxylase accessory protein YqeC